jgi:hypothetical protein
MSKVWKKVRPGNGRFSSRASPSARGRDSDREPNVKTKELRRFSALRASPKKLH